MSQLNTLLFEKLFFNSQTSSLSHKSKSEIFDLLIIQLSSKTFNQNNLSQVLNFMNHLLKNLNVNEFDDISFKFLNKLNEIYKDIMTKIKISKEDTLSELLSNLETVNLTYAKFFSIFNKNFQNYNDKHKTLIKLIPNGLKTYFKLFEDVFLPATEDINNDIVTIFHSFCLNVISLINYFPTMMRTFETRLFTILKTVLSLLVTSNFIKDKKLLKIVCITYSMLIRLSPDHSTKLNLFLNRLLENLKYYNNLFVPKTIKTIKSKSNNNETITNSNTNFNETLSLFSFKENILQKFKSPSIDLCNNIILIIVKLLKTIFKTLPQNKIYEINFNPIINLITENIENLKLNSELISISDTEYIVEGLQLDEYKIFKGFFTIQNMIIFKFMIKNFNSYLYYYIPKFKSMINLMIFNFDNEFNKYYEVNLEVLSVFEYIIKYFDTCLFTSIEEFMYKICVTNFSEMYVAYLERNDKSVVKVDQSYFKLAKMKNVVNFNSNNKKKGNISLIQMAKSENYNEKLENYSNSEIEKILIKYFEILITYFQSDLFSIMLTNTTHITAIKSIIDIVILPPYAKYIFSISETIKEKIGDLLFYYLKNSNDTSDGFNDYEKLKAFLNSFYSNSDSSPSKILQGIKMFIYII